VGVSIGIDIGGTKMLAGVVSRSGQVLASHQTPTRADAYMDDAEALVARALASARALGASVDGIGLGTTGLIDHARGRLRRSLGLGLADVPIRDRLEARFGLPAFVDNDIHAAALAELEFGVGRQHADFMLFNAGTGVSVGMVLGGRLHRGASNLAGEVGHTSLDGSGRACACGLPGCLEDSVVRARRGEDLEPVRFSHALEPSPGVEYGYLALTLVNLVNLLNPSAIVFAGGMYANRPDAVAWTADVLQREALEPAREAIAHVGMSAAGTEIGLIGAAALVLEGRRAHGPEVDRG
jgi:glucokinase